MEWQWWFCWFNLLCQWIRRQSYSWSNEKDLGYQTVESVHYGEKGVIEEISDSEKYFAEWRATKTHRPWINCEWTWFP